MDSSNFHQYLGASFRDPSGYLFVEGGVLYRQVNSIYKEDFERLIKTGLYDELVSEKLLIPHREVPKWENLPDECYKVIQPETIDFISYPYEWCFSQLKDAALATLKIQTKALEHDMVLKDSSAFNIQFHKGKPVLIDSLSFQIYKEGQPWIAYRQFCKHFLAPLYLMAYKDVRLSQLFRVYIDGVPLDLAARLLPFRARLSFPAQIHIMLHASSEKRFAGRSIDSSRKMSRTGMQGLIDSLERAVNRLRWSPSKGGWTDYYETSNYSQQSEKSKEDIIATILDRVSPESMWDLGANLGRYSRIASRMGIPTISIDNEPAAVELNYQNCLEENETNLLPLLLDLTNPSPDMGWDNSERESLKRRAPAEAVFALALIHHLAISNNVPLIKIAEFFQHLGRWLVIEFVPKEDSQVQKLLVSREDVFPDYDLANFESAFSVFFQIHQKFEINGTLRTIFLLESRKFEKVTG
jgi:hypothetical protein